MKLTTENTHRERHVVGKYLHGIDLALCFYECDGCNLEVN